MSWRLCTSACAVCAMLRSGEATSDLSALTTPKAASARSGCGKTTEEEVDDQGNPVLGDLGDHQRPGECPHLTVGGLLAAFRGQLGIVGPADPVHVNRFHGHASDQRCRAGHSAFHPERQHHQHERLRNDPYDRRVGNRQRAPVHHAQSGGHVAHLIREYPQAHDGRCQLREPRRLRARAHHHAEQPVAERRERDRFDHEQRHQCE